MDLLYGIKIWVVDYFVLSQNMRLTDRRTDGQVSGQTEMRQQYRALIETNALQLRQTATVQLL